MNGSSLMKKEIWALDPEILEEMIYISCNIKRDVVERDPKEQGRACTP